MDEIRNIVGDSPYYLKALFKARTTMLRNFFSKPGKHFPSVMAKCGLDHSSRNELFTSLDNPQFSLYDIRFDADIPDPFAAATSSSTSKKQSTATSSSECESASSCKVDDNTIDNIIVIDSSSSDGGSSRQNPIIIAESSSDNLAEKSEDDFIKLSSDESSNSSLLEEGELRCDENDGDENNVNERKLQEMDNQSLINNYTTTNGDLTNNKYRLDNRKRKFSMTDIENGNVEENDDFDEGIDEIDDDEEEIHYIPSEVTLTDQDMQCFQCELCGSMQQSKNDMLQHLKSAQHYSASKVIGTFCDGRIDSIKVSEESCLTNPASEYKTLVPICPECNKIFQTIYMCAVHFKIEHNVNVDDCYSIGKVKKEKHCLMNNDNNPSCNVCHRRFSDHKALRKHWEATGHWPYSLPEKNEIVLYMCPLCDLKFYKFFLAYQHLIYEHEQSNDKDLRLTVRYIERSYQYLKLLPVIHLTELDQYMSELKKVQLMKKKENYIRGQEPYCKNILKTASKRLTSCVNKMRYIQNVPKRRMVKKMRYQKRKEKRKQKLRIS